MSFDWSDYLLVAQELASQTTASQIRSNIRVQVRNVFNRTFHRERERSLEEAKLRCAISRAYYGAFRTVRNHLCDKDGQPANLLERSGRTHQMVINLFNQSNDFDRQLIGQFLKDLRSARNKADYDDTIPHLPGLTMTTLLQSEQVLDLLKTL